MATKPRQSSLIKRKISNSFQLHPNAELDRRGTLESGRRSDQRYKKSAIAIYLQNNTSIEDYYGGWLVNISTRGMKILFPQVTKDDVVKILSAPAPMLHLKLAPKQISIRSIPLRQFWNEEQSSVEVAFQFFDGEVSEELIRKLSN